jgi:zinc/manganese transport system permease protein
MGTLELLRLALGLPFFVNALVVLLALSLAAGVIGVFINLRGLEFYTDGLTHAVFPGLAAGFLAAGDPGVLPGALLAAAAATVALTVFSRRVTSDAVTAIVLTAMFSLGVLLVSASPGRAGGLEQLLFGHLFTITSGQALVTVSVALAALAVVLITRRAQLFRAFDEAGSAASGYRALATDAALNASIALVVVAASAAVGNLLVLAVLIVPGALARLLSAHLGAVFAISVGAAVGASVLGLCGALVVSVRTELGVPGGASVALTFVALYALAWVVRACRNPVARA